MAFKTLDELEEQARAIDRMIQDGREISVRQWAELLYDHFRLIEAHKTILNSYFESHDMAKRHGSGGVEV
jgi:hypothetical protein